MSAPLHRYEIEYRGRKYELEAPQGTSDAALERALLDHISRRQPTPPAPPPLQRTWGEALTDVPKQFYGGIGSLIESVGGLGTVTGLGGQGLMELGGGIRERAREATSPAYQQKLAEQQAAIQAAEAERGQLGAFGTAARTTLSDPALLLGLGVETLPSLFAGAGGGAAARLAATFATTSAKALSSAGVTGMIATNAAIHGGQVGAETYEEALEAAKKQGMSDTDAEARAVEVAQTAAAQAALVSVGSQFVPGGRSLERGIFGGDLGPGGVLRKIGRGVAGEALQEGIEEGSGQFFVGRGVQQIDPERDPLAGVGGAAGTGAAVGALFGGTAGGVRGVIDSRRQAEIDALEQQGRAAEARRLREAAQAEAAQRAAEAQARADEQNAELMAALRGRLDEDVGRAASLMDTPAGIRQLIAEVDETFKGRPKKERDAIRKDLNDYLAQVEADEARRAPTREAFEQAQPDLFGMIYPEAAHPLPRAEEAVPEPFVLGQRQQQMELDLQPREDGRITPTTLRAWGLPPAAIRGRVGQTLIGLDVNDAGQLATIRTTLEDYANRTKAPGVATAIANLPIMPVQGELELVGGKTPEQVAMDRRLEQALNDAAYEAHLERRAREQAQRTQRPLTERDLAEREAARAARWSEFDAEERQQREVLFNQMTQQRMDETPPGTQLELALTGGRAAAPETTAVPALSRDELFAAWVGARERGDIDTANQIETQYVNEHGRRSWSAQIGSLTRRQPQLDFTGERDAQTQTQAQTEPVPSDESVRAEDGAVGQTTDAGMGVADESATRTTPEGTAPPAPGALGTTEPAPAARAEAEQTRAETLEETPRAVQEQETAPVLAQSETRTGEGVGREVPTEEAAAREAETINREIQELQDKLIDLRDKRIPNATSNKQQDTLEQWAKNLEEKIRRLGEEPSASLAPTDAPGQPAQQIRDRINRIFPGIAAARRRVQVVESVDQLPEAARQAVESAERAGQRPQAYFDGQRAFMIADRIPEGTELGVLLHEVGSHMGMERLLGKQRLDQLMRQLNNWAQSKTGLEGQLADRAFKRAGLNAELGMATTAEPLAYFIEEAVNSGINPTALRGSNPVTRFLRQFMDAVRAALSRFGIMPANLDAQSIVDMAFGAANLPLSPRAGEVAPSFSARPLVNRPADTQTVTPSQIEQMLERAPPQVAGAAYAIRDSLRKFTNFSSFTSDFVDMAEKHLGRAVKDYYTTLERYTADRTNRLVRAQRVVAPTESMSKAEIDAINEFAFDSTFNEQWGFVPSWDNTITPNPEMAARFNEMSEAQQNVVRGMFDAAHEQRVELNRALQDKTRELYQSQIDRLKSPKRIREIERERDAVLRRMAGRFEDSKIPYLPLKRWGKLAVVAKSQAYLDAEARAQVGRGGPADAELERMKADPAHYLVSFTDNRAEAERLKRQWANEGFASSEAFNRMEYFQRNEAIPFGLIERMRQRIGETNTKSEKAIADALEQLYIQALDETSIRKSELRRRKVGGADRDMIRAYVENSEGMAHMTSSIGFNQDVQTQLQSMREEALRGEGDRNAKILALNEILARHASSLEFDNSWWNKVQGRLMGGTSVWMLLSSPAYYMQNATQPFMLTLPHLAGKHGYANSFNNLARAYTDITRAFKLSKETGRGALLDPAQLTDPAEQALLRHLEEINLFDIGITSDMGTLHGSKGAVGHTFNKVHQKLLGAARGVEMYNRGSTALAAFRMERQAQLDAGRTVEEANQLAADYAVREVQLTQGNYSQQNAPRLIENLPAGRLLFQFRKFQLIQIGLLARMVHQSFKGASPEEKAIARAQLGYTLGHHMVVGGVLGLPMMNLLAPLLAGMFDDDDLPRDFETRARLAIGDKDLSDLLLKGIPARLGVDTSQRLGMGQTFALMPFTDVKIDGEGYDAMVSALLGPTVAQGRMMADGVSLIANGNPWMGYTAMLPRGLRDALRSYADATEGVRNRRGDLAISPDELSFMDTMLRGIGWPTDVYTSRWMAQSAKYEVEQHFRNRTSDIKRMYVQAYDRNDQAGMERAKEAWIRLQETRSKHGFNRQPLSNMVKAVRERDIRERDTVGGVQVDRSSRQFVERLL